MAALAVVLNLLLLSDGLGAQTTAKQENAGERSDAQARQAPDIAKERQQILTSIETEPAVAAADQRWNCATGAEPGRVREARAAGRDFAPDASKSCPAVVRRELHDGREMELYERVAQLAGGQMTPQQVLKNTAAAAMGNQAAVPIGNGRGYQLTDAIAWDAGYTSGLMDPSITMQSLGLADSPANTQRLEGIAESCLDDGNRRTPKASACYVGGIALAARDKRAVAR